MSDVHTDTALPRTRFRGVNEVLLTSPWQPAGDLLPDEREYETLPWVGAEAPSSMPDQEPSAALVQLSPRVPPRWVLAAVFSLLALVLMAGAYWYVTGVHGTEDPYVDVGENGISTEVPGLVKDVDAACASSSCVRSPRSRLSPQAIVGRPESRQDHLHLAALHHHLEAAPMSVDLNDDVLTLRSDGARHMLISLHQRHGD